MPDKELSDINRDDRIDNPAVRAELEKMVNEIKDAVDMDAAVYAMNDMLYESFTEGWNGRQMAAMQAMIGQMLSGTDPQGECDCPDCTAERAEQERESSSAEA